MNGLHISIWLVVQSDDFLCNMRKVFGLFKMLWLWCISSVFVWYMWFSFTRSYWVHHSVIKASHDWSSTGEVYPTSQYTRSCEQWTQCSNPRVSSRVVYLWEKVIHQFDGRLYGTEGTVSCGFCLMFTCDRHNTFLETKFHYKEHEISVMSLYVPVIYWPQISYVYKHVPSNITVSANRAK